MIEERHSSADRSRAFYRHLGANGLASRTKAEWDTATVDAVVALLPPSGDVLDVGCGYGRIALPLARRGYRVTGVDISPGLLRAARRDARAANLAVRFDEASMTALPYADASFDACVCLWSAFYELLAPDEQVRALREMDRVLRSAGIGAIEGPPYAATDDHLAGNPRITAEPIMGRRHLLYAHDEASLLDAAAAAGLSTARVETRIWAGRPRQLLLFSKP